MNNTKPVSIEKVIKISIVVMMIIITVFTVFGVVSYFYFTHGLPSIDTLKNYKPSTISKIFSEEGRSSVSFPTKKEKWFP